MTFEERQNALQIIEETQRRNKCGSIILEIGGVDEKHNIECNSLYLIESPPCVIDMLKVKGYSFDISKGRLKVLHFTP